MYNSIVIRAFGLTQGNNHSSAQVFTPAFCHLLIPLPDPNGKTSSMFISSANFVDQRGIGKCRIALSTCIAVSL